MVTGEADGAGAIREDAGPVLGRECPVLDLFVATNTEALAFAGSRGFVLGGSESHRGELPAGELVPPGLLQGNPRQARWAWRGLEAGRGLGAETLQGFVRQRWSQVLRVDLRRRGRVPRLQGKIISQRIREILGEECTPIKSLPARPAAWRGR